jgi:hypothetical protein
MGEDTETDLGPGSLTVVLDGDDVVLTIRHKDRYAAMRYYDVVTKNLRETGTLGLKLTGASYVNDA